MSAKNAPPTGNSVLCYVPVTIGGLHLEVYLNHVPAQAGSVDSTRPPMPSTSTIKSIELDGVDLRPLLDLAFVSSGKTLTEYIEDMARQQVDAFLEKQNGLS